MVAFILITLHNGCVNVAHFFVVLALVLLLYFMKSVYIIYCVATHLYTTTGCLAVRTRGGRRLWCYPGSLIST